MQKDWFVDSDGDKYWYVGDQFHREDGPAIEGRDGNKIWYLNGELHREDGPAYEYADGTKLWYYKDLFVGEGDAPDPGLWERVTSVEANGGPLLNGCIVDGYEDTRWYKDDKLHREDGPAFEFASGNKMWHFNGELLGWNKDSFWKLWDLLTDEQRANPKLLKWMPR